MDDFILKMPYDKWFKIGDDETKLAVIKDWIEKDCLKDAYLVLSEDYKLFVKREKYRNKILVQSKRPPE